MKRSRNHGRNSARLAHVSGQGNPYRSDAGSRKPLWARAAVAVIAGLLVLLGGGAASAEEKSVAEQILDILRANGQITETQYKDLMVKAGAEKENGTDKGGDAFDVSWKNGLQVESKDKEFKLHLGGRVYVDYGVIGTDDDVKRAYSGDIAGHGAELRTARFLAEGTIYDAVGFKTEFNLAEGDPSPTDVYIAFREIPYVGNILAGHMKEPFSLEELTSSRFITFMERALPNAFAPARNVGFLLQDAELDSRMTWAVGAFQETDEFAEAFADYSDYSVTARITGLPWYVGNAGITGEGENLVHLGLSYSHRFRSGEDNPVRYRTRPESHLTDVRLVDTGGIPADSADLVNSEIALVYGPFSVQGEYFHSFVDARRGGDADFSGYYVFASCFLTGEQRNYKRSTGVFDRITPLRNFHPKEWGWGAWEVAARYSHIDLNDSGITGGDEDNFTFGLNWYLNPNTRIMLNYIYAQLDDGPDLDDEDVNILQSRVQVDF